MAPSARGHRKGIFVFCRTTTAWLCPDTSYGRIGFSVPSYTPRRKSSHPPHTSPSVTFQLEPHSPEKTGSPVPSYTPQRRRPPTHTDQDGYTMGPPLRWQHAVPGCIWTLLWKDMCFCSFVLRLRHRISLPVRRCRITLT